MRKPQTDCVWSTDFTHKHSDKKDAVFSVNSEKGFERMKKIKGGHDGMPGCYVLAGENRAMMMMLISELILHWDPS